MVAVISQLFQHKKVNTNSYPDSENVELINVVGFYTGGSLNMNNIYDKPTETVPGATGSLKKVFVKHYSVLVLN